MISKFDAFLMLNAIPMGFFISTNTDISKNIFVHIYIFMIILVFFIKSIKSIEYAIVLMLFLLAIVPNSTILSGYRDTQGVNIRLFIRYIGGLFNYWDLILLMAFSILAFKKKH